MSERVRRIIEAKVPQALDYVDELDSREREYFAAFQGRNWVEQALVVRCGFNREREAIVFPFNLCNGLEVEGVEGDCCFSSFHVLLNEFVAVARTNLDWHMKVPAGGRIDVCWNRREGVYRLYLADNREAGGLTVRDDMSICALNIARKEAVLAGIQVRLERGRAAGTLRQVITRFLTLECEVIKRAAALMGDGVGAYKTAEKLAHCV